MRVTMEGTMPEISLHRIALQGLLGLALVATFAACGSDPGTSTADAGGNDADGGSGDTGLPDAIDSDTDTDTGECVPGTDGCPCDPDGACAEDLSCDPDSDTCEPCVWGEDECPCVPGQTEDDPATCDEGLTCSDENVCECVPGTLECPCVDGDACDGGLECVAGLCAEPGCVPGTTDCPCDDGACASADDYCSDRGVCETCASDAVGCACETACSNDLVCDTGVCREPATCADIGCLSPRICDAGAGRDAVCLEDCELGYVWNAATGTCDAAPDCGACEDDNRSCSLSTGSPVCGDCVDGYLEDPDTDACVDVVTCFDLDCESLGQRCTEAEFTGAGAVGATCSDNPCEEGYLLSGDSCVECSQCYEFPSGGAPTARPGVIGNELEAFESGLTAMCVCQFDPDLAGRFQSVETGQITLCDADGDGWTNVRFMDVIKLDLDAADNTLAQNATCDLRTIDRFELRSDDAPDTWRTVRVSEIVDEFGVQPSQFETDDFGTQFVYVVEPEELDIADQFEARYSTGALNRLSAYPGGRLRANEVNPLTRACSFQSSTNDDLNLDRYVDVTQSQELPYSRSVTRPTAVFYHMAYYMELSRGYWRQLSSGAGDTPSPGGHGAYVIQEKSRSAAATESLALELTYTSDEGSYWQECLRNRDTAYPNGESFTAETPAAEVPLNFDFAHWQECEVEGDGTGHCQVGDSSAEVQRRGIDYIAYDGRRPATAAARYDEAGDGVWPGMNHHSQFKCVSLADETNPTGYVDPAELDDATREWTLVECRLSDGTTRTVGSDAALGAGANPADPQFDCTPVTDTLAIGNLSGVSESTGQRYWVVSRYQHYEAGDPDRTEYTRGCINEAYEWPFLCNGFDVDPRFSTANPSGTRGNFGRLVCGCSVNNGGPECDLGCPTANLHYGGTYADDAAGSYTCTNGYCLTHAAVPGESFDGGRRGFWMCGDFSSTAHSDPLLPPDFRSPDFTESDDGVVTGWRLDGEIPAVPVARVRLTEPGAAEGSGWSVY